LSIPAAETVKAGTLPRAGVAMQPRDLARFGFGLLAAANVVFFLAGFARGPVYLTLQLASVGLSMLAWRLDPGPLAGALGGLAAVRLLTVALDLSKLPLWLNVALFACAVAGAMAAGARRWALLRASAWAMATGYFVAMGASVAGGNLGSTFGLLLATFAWSFVAPNVGPASDARAAVAGDLDAPPAG
jgi:hypothetical protein